MKRFQINFFNRIFMKYVNASILILCVIFFWIINSFGADNSIDCSEVFEKISTNHIEGTSIEKTKEDAIRLYLRSLDKYSKFYNKNENTLNTKDDSVSFIGANIYRYNNKILIFPKKNGPLYRYGITKRYYLIAINNFYIANKSLRFIEDFIKISIDPKLELTLLDLNEDIIRTVRIKRRRNVSNNTTFVIRKGVIIIRIEEFVKNITFDTINNILLSHKGKRILLDLRGSPGGDLYEAIDIASLFLKPGKIIVSTVDKNNIKKDYLSGGKQQIVKNNIYTLIDQFTASSAEVLAYALQFHKVSTLFGQKSLGKCTSQAYYRLKNGSSLKLTNLRLIRPNGNKCDGKGVSPNVEIDAEYIDDIPYIVDTFLLRI